MITNMEHFRGEIEALDYFFTLYSGKISECVSPNCGYCDFDDLEDGNCTKNIIKWLMAEYKPTPVLTEREKHFVKFAETGWISRNTNNALHWYKSKPVKGVVSWNGSVHSFECEELNTLFPFITWEDEEPWSVEELRKLEVKE